MKYYLFLCRPKQWVKNLACLSVLFITPNLNYEDFKNCLLTSFVFIIASSFIYVLNDIVDLESDRSHLIKRNRPLAAGKISKRGSKIFLLFIFILILFFGFFIQASVFLIICSYIFTQIFYSFYGKHKPLLDIYLIGLGFILRFLSGVFTIGTEASPWFLITSGCMALFLAIQKRKGELRSSKDKSKLARKVLQFYTYESLNSFESIIVSTGFTSYILWASGPIFSGSQNSNLLITAPLVLIGITRYQYIGDSKDLNLSTESPTNIAFEDKYLKLIFLLWSITTYLLINQ